MHVHVHTHTHTHAHVHTHTHILQVLSSKRYDLEGFAEYARHLRECQTFDEKEATNINYVLRVHSILFRHGIDVPQQDKVASCKLTHTHTHFLRNRIVSCLLYIRTYTCMKCNSLVLDSW